MAQDKFGFVKSISIASAPGALSGCEFEFSMRNLITGPNGAGKSMLARLIAGLSYPDQVAEASLRSDIDLTVRWFDPNERYVTTKGRAGRLEVNMDGRVVPYVARPYKTIYMRPDHGGRSDLSLVGLTQLLDLSLQRLRATLELLPHRCPLVKEIRVGADGFEALMEVSGQIRRVAPDENDLAPAFLAVLAGVSAGHHAESEPTMLILDEPECYMHPSLEIAFLDHLERSAGSAQLAVITHSPQLVHHFGAAWPVTALELPSRSNGESGPPAISAEFTTSSSASEPQA